MLGFSSYGGNHVVLRKVPMGKVEADLQESPEAPPAASRRQEASLPEVAA